MLYKVRNTLLSTQLVVGYIPTFTQKMCWCLSKLVHWVHGVQPSTATDRYIGCSYQLAMYRPVPFWGPMWASKPSRISG